MSTQPVDQILTEWRAYPAKVAKDRVTSYVLGVLGGLAAIGAIALFCTGFGTPGGIVLAAVSTLLVMAAIYHYKRSGIGKAEYAKSCLQKLDPQTVEIERIGNEKEMLKELKPLFDNLPGGPQNNLDLLARFPRTVARLIVDEAAATGISGGVYFFPRVPLYQRLNREQAKAFQNQIDDSAPRAGEYGYDADIFLVKDVDIVAFLEEKRQAEIESFFREVHDASFESLVIYIQHHYPLSEPEKLSQNQKKVVMALGAVGRLGWLAPNQTLDQLIENLQKKTILEMPNNSFES